MNDEKHLREILMSWGQFPAPTEADFNCLVQEVLVALTEGSDRQMLEAVIQNEFNNHHGADGPAEEIRNVSKTLCDWWSSKES